MLWTSAESRRHTRWTYRLREDLHFLPAIDDLSNFLGRRVRLDNLILTLNPLLGFIAILHLHRLIRLHDLEESAKGILSKD